MTTSFKARTDIRAHIVTRLQQASTKVYLQIDVDVIEEGDNAPEEVVVAHLQSGDDEEESACEALDLGV